MHNVTGVVTSIISSLPSLPGVSCWLPVAVIALFKLINYRAVRSCARTHAEAYSL